MKDLILINSLIKGLKELNTFGYVNLVNNAYFEGWTNVCIKHMDKLNDEFENRKITDALVYLKNVNPNHDFYVCNHGIYESNDEPRTFISCESLATIIAEHIEKYIAFFKTDFSFIRDAYYEPFIQLTDTDFTLHYKGRIYDIGEIVTSCRKATSDCICIMDVTDDCNWEFIGWFCGATFFEEKYADLPNGIHYLKDLNDESDFTYILSLIDAKEKSQTV